MEAIWPPSSEIPNMSWVRHADKARYWMARGGLGRGAAPNPCAVPAFVFIEEQ
jgi:hypothetical protein